MDKIVRTHEKILDHLLKLRVNDSQLYFVARKINNKNRLDNGYWFIGNDYYLNISFWNGGDWKEKIHNIGFVVNKNKESWIELSAQDSSDKAEFLKRIVSNISGFKKESSKNKWFKYYKGTEYLKNFDDFIQNIKPVIDNLMRRYKPDGIKLIDANFFNQNTGKIIDLRKKQIDYGEENKITRICWNLRHWKSPSGSVGKSTSGTSYEFRFGFGHEEWLFDKSKIINGYQYSFLESLHLESDKHVGKKYNLSLFTISNVNKKYFVCELQNAECISREESAQIYNIYKSNEWIKEMESSLKKAGANSRVFIKTEPEIFFNFKFKSEDILYPEYEPVEISDEDVNITTFRFKLLPKKTEFIFKTNVEEGEDDEGNKKNTNLRKRVFNIESEFDPYHDKMQNAIYELLKDSKNYQYKKVIIEKDRVDIKAKTPQDKWHYFEIKTDNPKLCIRKAIGQIMEYAYFPDAIKAEKLIIVGDEKPDDDTLKYLDHIRNNFGLPVTYRHYNFETNILSDDF